MKTPAGSWKITIKEIKRGDKPSEDLWLWSKTTRLRSPAKTPVGIWSDSINGKLQKHVFWKKRSGKLKGRLRGQSDISATSVRFLTGSSQVPHWFLTGSSVCPCFSFSGSSPNKSINLFPDPSHHPLQPGCSHSCPYVMVLTDEQQEAPTSDSSRAAAHSSYYQRQHLVEIKQPCQR